MPISLEPGLIRGKAILLLRVVIEIFVAYIEVRLEKCTSNFTDSTASTMSSTSKAATDILMQLSNVLPTGTFLVFQILAPLATNNGSCERPEVIITSITLTTLCILCASCFTDSYKAENGVVYYGFVTPQGLWNPNFNHAEISGCSGSYYKDGGIRYLLEMENFVNAGLSIIALATVSQLTDPVAACLYPGISQSIQKSVLILVGLVVAAVCTFGTTPRNGIGFAMAAR